MATPCVADYVTVPSGEFLLGSSRDDESSEPEEWPQLTVSVPAFLIKRTVVTVGEWRVFLERSRYRWDRWKAVETTSPTDEHPIVCVNWHDARAYCIWGGRAMSRRMRLPGEIEWEKACRGDRGQLYPTQTNGEYDEDIYYWTDDEWHASLKHSKILTEEEFEIAVKPDDTWTEAERKTGDAAWRKIFAEEGVLFLNRVVGRNPTVQTPYGCLGMWESVSEWCDNWFDEELYEKIAHHAGDTAAALAESPKCYKAFRGGGLFSRPRCARRGYNYASYTNEYLGFRPVIEV